MLGFDLSHERRKWSLKGRVRNRPQWHTLKAWIEYFLWFNYFKMGFYLFPNVRYIQNQKNIIKKYSETHAKNLLKFVELQFKIKLYWIRLKENKFDASHQNVVKEFKKTFTNVWKLEIIVVSRSVVLLLVFGPMKVVGINLEVIIFTVQNCSSDWRT